MPKRLTFEDDRRIIRLLFEGHSVDEIADLIQVSVPTVRNRRKRFSSEAEEFGLMSAAKRYGVEQQVTELMDLSGQIKESGVTPKACIDGCKLLGRLNGLGVDPSNLDGFVAEVYMEAESQNLDPRELVSLCLEMRRLKTETGKGFTQMVREFEDYKETNERLMKENERLEADRRENVKAFQRELRENEANLYVLKWFKSVEAKLADHGVQVEELDELSTLMENFKEKGYDSESLVRFYSKTTDLEDQLLSLEADVKNQDQVLAGIRVEREDCQEFLKDNEGLVGSVQDLIKLDLTEKMVRNIVEVVIEISARHGMDASAALKKFYSDLVAQYDAKLGYDNQIQRLKSISDRVEQEIVKKRVQIRTLEESFKSKAGVIDALRHLNGLGVTNEDLLGWSEIMRRIPTDLPSFRKEMETLGGIKRVVEERQASLRHVESRLKEREAELEDLEEKRNILEARIRALTSKFIEVIEENLTKVCRVVDEFERAFLSPESGFEAKSIEIIEGTHSKIRKLIDETARRTEAQFGKLDENISSLVEESKAIREAAYEGGKAVGQYKALEPIYRIFIGEKIPKDEALAAMHITVENMGWWLRNNEEEEIARESSRFINSLHQGLLNVQESRRRDFRRF